MGTVCYMRSVLVGSTHVSVQLILPATRVLFVGRALHFSYAVSF